MDFVALSHLRWDFVYQRPQHLMSRASRHHRVLFVEEPEDGPATMGMRAMSSTLTVVTPSMPPDWTREARDVWLSEQLEELVRRWKSHDELVLWHWDVMAEPVSRRLDADAVVFDCMDELRLFLGAPPQLVLRERALLRRADVVFTGGHSLWEAKRGLHPSVHAFPSGVDLDHFGRARAEQPEPLALRGIPRPRLVYAGVIDERIDLPLLGHLAAAEVAEVLLIGPVAKIGEHEVPAGPNLHRLGMREYQELPALFAHCDVGIMPFALNDATRYISPTKAPEYLAAGLPVVSTPIRDVVRGYGDLEGAVTIADGGAAFVDACERAMRSRAPSGQVDRHLAGRTWDAVWDGMERLILDATTKAGAA